MSNSHEGNIFVPQSFTSLYDAGGYAAELYPHLQDTDAVTAVYATAGSNFDQLAGVFGEGKYSQTRLLKLHLPN
jgi:hypothetical protein